MEVKNKIIEKIGLVVSGGLTKGVAQLAFLKPLIEKIGYNKIKVISGASIGSLNAFAISSKRIDELLKFYKGLDIDNMRSFIKAMKGRFYSKAFNVAESDELSVTTYVNATKLPNFDPYYFCLNSMTRGDIKKVLDASMGFPIVNGHKRFKGQLFFDGGATDNVPYYPMDYFDLDMVIVVHCYAKYQPEEYMLRDDRIFVDVDSTLSIDQKITPFSISKESLKVMLETGAKDGKIFADTIFKDFDYGKVKQRCREYTLTNLEKRKSKFKDLLTSVDITNELYRLKIGKHRAKELNYGRNTK